MSTPAPVPDKVLSWLYSSLTSQYHDPSRAYSDIARFLHFHQRSFTPRTDTFIYENGTPALLLLLRGTLAVTFRGRPYRFPMSIWLPHSYPQEPPMIYFVPDETLAIRPGQHVSVEGRVYHPYLAQWTTYWERSSLVDCLGILQDTFSREPPLTSRTPRDFGRPQPTQSPGVRSSPAPPAIPTPSRARFPSHADGFPPDPPPKPTAAQTATSAHIERRSSSLSGPPPRPPKNGQVGMPLPGATASPAIQASPWMAPQDRLQSASHPPRERPVSMSLAGHDQRISRYSQPAPLPFNNNQPQFNDRRNFKAPQYAAPGFGSGIGSYQPATPPRDERRPQEQQPQRLVAPMRPEAQDILSLPLEAASPNRNADLPAQSAPPIPRNPERDTLLQTVSSACRGHLERGLAQNTAALPALEAQQSAIQQALRNMQHEAFQLEELTHVLAGNESVLRSTMLDADHVVENAKKRDLPHVDEVLVAPTVVGEQLYKAIAEERSIGDAMFALTKALEKGRVASDVFLKQTRSLAREQFLQKSLIKKIARGLGLILA